jgi:hypothetical protein
MYISYGLQTVNVSFHILFCAEILEPSRKGVVGTDCTVLFWGVEVNREVYTFEEP